MPAVTLAEPIALTASVTVKPTVPLPALEHVAVRVAVAVPLSEHPAGADHEKVFGTPVPGQVEANDVDVNV